MGKRKVVEEAKVDGGAAAKERKKRMLSPNQKAYQEHMRVHGKGGKFKEAAAMWKQMRTAKTSGGGLANPGVGKGMNAPGSGLRTPGHGKGTTAPGYGRGQVAPGFGKGTTAPGYGRGFWGDLSKVVGTVAKHATPLINSAGHEKTGKVTGFIGDLLGGNVKTTNTGPKRKAPTLILHKKMIN